MTQLSKEYQEILDDLEKNIKDEEELKYVKQQIYKVTSLFMEQVDKLILINETKMAEMEEKQKEMGEKIENLTNSIDEIEKDIYMDDQEELEIACPYCNFKFTEEFDENKKEIKCPECNNIIELEWNDDDDSCSGNCSGCQGCGEE